MRRVTLTGPHGGAPPEWLCSAGARGTSLGVHPPSCLLPAEGVTRTGESGNQFVAHIGETKTSAAGRKKTVYRYLGAFRTATAAALEYAREKKRVGPG